MCYVAVTALIFVEWCILMRQSEQCVYIIHNAYQYTSF